MIELVSPDRCIECGICVRVCPTNVFDGGSNELPRIARQHDCQTCFMCEVYCPADALYVSPHIAMQPALDEQQLIAEQKLGSYRKAIGWGRAQGLGASEDKMADVIEHVSKQGPALGERTNDRRCGCYCQGHRGVKMKKVNEECVSEVLRVLERGRLFRYDVAEPYESDVTRLEHTFARLIGRRFCVAVNSCSSGLLVALLAAGLEPGDQVLVPAVYVRCRSQRSLSCRRDRQTRGHDRRSRNRYR